MILNNMMIKALMTRGLPEYSVVPGIMPRCRSKSNKNTTRSGPSGRNAFSSRRSARQSRRGSCRSSRRAGGADLLVFPLTIFLPSPWPNASSLAGADRRRQETTGDDLRCGNRYWPPATDSGRRGNAAFINVATARESAIQDCARITSH